MMKNYNLASQKNLQEDETRNETTGTQYFDLTCLGISSIHSKKKEFK